MKKFILICISILLIGKVYASYEWYKFNGKIRQAVDIVWIKNLPSIYYNKYNCWWAPACYFRISQEIYVTTRAKVRNIIHEIGHHIVRGNMPVCGKYVTEYARKNKWEMGAEFFEYYFIYNKMLSIWAKHNICYDNQWKWLEKLIDNYE